MSGEIDLTLEQQRLLDGQCTRCGAEARGDANLCVGCTDDARRRQREMRQRRRAQGQCAYCGKRSKTRRCPRCLRRERHEQPRVTAPQGGDNQANHVLRTKVEHRLEADGYERTRVRYIGRGTRGAPSKEQLDQEQLRNVRFARKELGALEARLQQALQTPKEMPVIQRVGVWTEVLGSLGFTARLLEEVEDHVKARIKRLK